MQREKAELKVKELKAKIRSGKDSLPVAENDPGKEDESVITTLTSGRISRSSSFDGENELAEGFTRTDPSKFNPDGSGSKLNSTEGVQKGEQDIMVTGSPLESKDMRKTINPDLSEMSPPREYTGRSIPIPKPPILPTFQKKAMARNQTVTSPSLPPSKKGAEVRQNAPAAAAATLSGGQNAADCFDGSKVGSLNSSPPKPNLGQHVKASSSVDTTKSVIQPDVGLHNVSGTSNVAPPRPSNVIIKSRCDSGSSHGATRVPGSSLTKNFDPLAPVVNYESTSTDVHAASDEQSNVNLFTAVPGFVVDRQTMTPIASDGSDLISFQVDSWMQTPTFDSFTQSQAGSVQEVQPPLFLVHQPVTMQSWPSYQSAQFISDMQQYPMMTYSTDQFMHSRQPSVSDVGSSQAHSRNPSMGQSPHVNQSWSSSPIHHGTNHPDTWSSDEFGITLSDTNANDCITSENVAPKPAIPPSIPGDDFFATSDPFDDLVQRKLHSDDFGT